MPDTRDIRNIRSRLERWELAHLRALSLSLHNQLEEANTRAAEADSWAQTWWRNAETLQEELLQLADQSGAQVGLTQEGDIVVLKPAADTSASPTIPAPGQHWPEQGGTYLGIAPAEGNLPMRHLVVLDAEADDTMTWAEAINWALDHGNGARLPTQLEAMIGRTIARAAFNSGYHWTGSQHSRNNAFVQDFENGYSNWYLKGNAYRVRAFRGLDLQTLNPLTGDATAPAEKI